MTETLTPQRTFEPAPPPPPDTTSPPEPRKVTVADVLERAADLLGEFGWCQGELGSRARGTFCVGGAIFEAARDLAYKQPDGRDAFAALKRELRPGLATSQWNVAHGWNDAPGRTEAEVISALRAAASSARTKEEA